MKLDVKDNNHAKMSHTQERFRDKTVLNEEIKITFKEICELDDKIENDTGTLKVKIQRLAELYEEQYNLNGFPEQVHEICSELIRLFAREGKSNLKPYIVEVLDSKYKRVSSENSTSHLEREHSNLPEECSTASDTPC